MMDERQNRIQSFAFVLCAFAGLCFAVYFSSSRMNIFSASTTNTTKVISQINPNTAEAESLIRLPDIGFSLAYAIIDYRNNYIKYNHNVPAFKTIDDLQNVKGIGPKTVQNMKDLLKFE
jgi:competence ComEA-like helix-hairpin-helix protein